MLRRGDSTVEDDASRAPDPAWRTSAGVAGRAWERHWPIAVVLLGAALRIARFFANRSLWNDEGAIARNIADLPLADLFHQPLKWYGQAAPAAWLALEHASVSVFGTGEMALRLVPLLGGLISLPLVVVFARSVLPNRAAFFAAALFAASEAAVHAASDAKQYSTDITVALGLLVLGLRALERATPARLAGLAAGGAVAIWFSHPAVFVLAAIGSTIALSNWFDGRRGRALAACGISALWVASFATNFAVVSADVAKSDFLQKFWANDFAPIPPRRIADLLWFPEALLRWSKDVYQTFDTPGMPPIGSVFSGLVLVLIVVGAVTLAREQRSRFAMIGLPFFFALAASAAHRYPFRGRFLLFLLPFLVVCVSAGLRRLRESNGRFGFGGAVLSLAVFAPALAVSGWLKLAQFPGHQETRSAWEYARDHWKDGDALYVYPDAQFALDYYWHHCPNVGAPRGEVIHGSAGDWPTYEDALRQLQGKGRVWVLFSHTSEHLAVAHEPVLLDLLDRRAKRLDEHAWVGASVHLYEFR